METLPYDLKATCMLESSSGGSGLEPGTVPGHGWEERGSSQVIWSSKSEVRSILN